ncbi:hypothetical protein EVAR_63417_1 [Eumeta japonica]|uniref:Uncharacterized protein n=1 Tax=Eumeta variegata TaxID=151549 RepID=A0A4C1Z1L5_EUMVA|nr:hypothetical protein EVAR_63417_1 [Eumeta japonica]
MRAAKSITARRCHSFDITSDVTSAKRGRAGGARSTARVRVRPTEIVVCTRGVLRNEAEVLVVDVCACVSKPSEAGGGHTHSGTRRICRSEPRRPVSARLLLSLRDSPRPPAARPAH